MDHSGQAVAPGRSTFVQKQAYTRYKMAAVQQTSRGHGRVDRYTVNSKRSIFLYNFTPMGPRGLGRAKQRITSWRKVSQLLYHSPMEEPHEATQLFGDVHALSMSKLAATIRRRSLLPLLAETN